MYPQDFKSQYRFSKLEDRVFVGMWFGAPHKSRYEHIIKPAIENMQTKKLTPYRVDQPTTAGSISLDIQEGILNSRLLLFEISFISTEQIATRYRNANVMYEIGLAHAWRLKEEVVVLRKDQENLPFDIEAYRVHRYDPRNIQDSINQISNLLDNALKEIDRRKSQMVKRARESLDAGSLSFINSNKGHYFSETDVRDLELRITIMRLLDLGLLYLHSSNDGRYAYHWTELGRDVIISFGIDIVNESLS